MTATSDQPTSGMWAPYVPPEIGEKLDVLAEAGDFVLLEVKVREGVPTRDYGPRDAVDLRVATTDGDKTRMFSGFSAGIVGQAKRVGPGDLPAVCRIVDVATQKGQTRGLELVRQLPAGVDVATIAAALSTPVGPIAGTTPDDIPY